METLSEIVRAHVHDHPKCVVGPSTIVVHLRLGDVFEWTTRYDCAERTARHEACTYATPPQRVAHLVRNVPGTVLLVGDPWYRASELRHRGQRSLAYVSELRRQLEQMQRNVSVALGRAPDCDMVAFRTTSVMVTHSRGGFAAIARELARANGATVLTR